MANKPSLSLFKSLAYSTGNLGSMLINQIIVMWVIFYYVPPPEEKHLIVYAPMLYLGYAMTFGRVVDAIADPLVGFWSDRVKTRMGRRIPFILYGTIPLVLLLILCWYPPIPHSSIINVYYIALILGLFFLYYTIVVAPYLALLPEIATTREERLNLVTYQAYFGVVGLFVAFLLSGYLVEHYGFKIMGIIVGIITLISFCLPVIFIKETEYTEAKEVSLSLSQSVFYTLKNKPFLYYVICLGFFWLGFNIIMVALPYLVVVIMKVSKDWAGYSLGILLIVAVAFFPVVNFTAKKFGKKIVFLLTILLLSLFLPLFLTVGRWPILTSFHQGLIVIGITGIPISGLLVLPYAILSEIIDYDEKNTGFRREAMYFGMEGLVTKGAIAASSLVATQVLYHFGFSTERSLGILLCGPAAAALVFIGFLIFSKYPFRD